jgi:hypothetical protein
MALQGDDKVRSDLAKKYLQQMANPNAKIMFCINEGEDTGCFFCRDSMKKANVKTDARCAQCIINPYLCSHGGKVGFIVQLKKYSTFGQFMHTREYQLFKEIIEDVAATGKWNIPSMIAKAKAARLEKMMDHLDITIPSAELLKRNSSFMKI